jgi:hypothetical protein
MLPSYFPGFGAKATIHLIKESNQRKSRKNNASPPQNFYAHLAIGKIAELRFATVLSSSRAWYLFLVIL